MKRIANKSLIIIMFVIIFSIAFNLGGTVYAEGEVQPIPEEIVVDTAMETTVEEEKEPEIIEEIPITEEPIVDEIITEEPITEEVVIEEVIGGTEETIVEEELPIEEPVVIEEIPTEETIVEEEISTEERIVEEPIVEEPTEEIITEEPITEVPEEEITTEPEAIDEISEEVIETPIDGEPIEGEVVNPEEEVIVVEGVVLDEASNTEVLETNEASLARMALLAEIARTEVTASNFTELEEIFLNATTNPLKITITDRIEFLRTLYVRSGNDILLTSNGEPVTPIVSTPIVLPNADDTMERKQELVEEARAAGDKAIADTDLTINPIVKPDVVLTRADGFIGTLIVVNNGGKLTIGVDNTDPIFFDGQNKKTNITSGGTVITTTGEVTINGGTITGFDNGAGYSAPIKVENRGVLNMNGGRITDNSVGFSYTYPMSAGGVYVQPGGTFNFSNGSIDNNVGAAGAVHLGSLFLNSNGYEPATMNMDGGIISHNSGTMLSSGIWAHSTSELNITDGILAGNSSQYANGGAIAVHDVYVYAFDGATYSNTYKTPYEEYVVHNKAELNMDGGLIYNNEGYNGGGIYVSSDFANLNDGYLLDNKATNMGGAVYVSIVPYTFTLKDALVSENHSYTDSSIYHWPSGNGGGLWNCPVGTVIFEDFHSAYFFNNTADISGEDLYMHPKNLNYTLNRVKVGQTFYTTISVVTKDGNLINYLTNGEYPPRITETNGMVAVESHYTDATIAEAWKNSTVFIMGN